LILNHGQRYAITVEAETPVESFCLFFAAGLADEVCRSLVTPIEHLLAEPDRQATSSLAFFERTYAHDAILSPLLFQLRQTLTQQHYERGWLTEQLHLVMQRLLQVHYRVYQEVETLPAVRAATREELYRRLYLAKEYVAAAFDQPITLNDMADVAGLSPNHLLRMFKQLFHQTPYQYLTTQRLNQAQQLLSQTDRSVTDICFSVGFESLGAFSWLFRRRVGLAPTEYRRQNR
jgi:AraC family transcriptional regulator